MGPICAHVFILYMTLVIIAYNSELYTIFIYPCLYHLYIYLFLHNFYIDILIYLCMYIVYIHIYLYISREKEIKVVYNLLYTFIKCLGCEVPPLTPKGNSV